MRLRFPTVSCIALATTLVLAACSSAPNSEPEAPAPPEPQAPSASAPATPVTTAPASPPMQECNADAAQSVVGKKATDAVIEEARIAAGAKVARALRPDMMVTMEYRGDRLNLRTDTQDLVVGVACG